MADILPQISPWILIGIGLILVGAEMFLTVFVLLFFGLGFITVGIGSFIFDSAGENQILLSVLIGGGLTFILRNYFKSIMTKEDLALETLQTGDIGIIIENKGELRVEYKGTSWAYSMETDFSPKVGEKVIVTALKNNVATILPKS